MYYMQRSFLLFITFFCTAFVQASDISEQVEIIQSTHLNEQRQIQVTLPAEYAANPNKHYPVIYLLGALADRPLLTALLSRLNAQDAAPQVIIAMIENTGKARGLA